MRADTIRMQQPLICVSPRVAVRTLRLDIIRSYNTGSADTALSFSGNLTSKARLFPHWTSCVMVEYRHVPW
jgi:hypothetical protein